MDIATEGFEYGAGRFQRLPDAGQAGGECMLGERERGKGVLVSVSLQAG
jgi:hypothetical protein